MGGTGLDGWGGSPYWTTCTQGTPTRPICTPGYNHCREMFQLLLILARLERAGGVKAARLHTMWTWGWWLVVENVYHYILYNV